ncbi:MAG: TolC family protein [Candidatus Entotheonellia bacterium]
MRTTQSLHGSLWPVVLVSLITALMSSWGPCIPFAPVAHAVAAAPATLPPAGNPPANRLPSQLPLSLYQSVLLALHNSLDIRVERLNPLIREEEVRKEAGVFFSPRLNFDIGADRAQKPTGTVLAGAEVLETQNVDLNTGVSMRSITGGVVSLDLRNKRFESNSAFQTFDPQYTADLALTLTHPFLKNFGIGVNVTRLKIAQNSAEMSKHQLKSVVTNLISDVQQTYWDLLMARNDLAARRRSVEVTQYLHKRTEEMVATGRLPAIAILQAKATVLEREIDLGAAENALEDAQVRLKSLLNLHTVMEPARFTIVPIDAPVFQMQMVSAEEGLKRALTNRPEIFQARLDQENRLLGVNLAKNQRLPEVNFVGSVGLSGLSGSPTSFPFADLTIGGIPIGTFSPGEQNSFEGGFGDALSKLFSGNFVSYKVGITVQIPLGNQSSRSELARARLEAEKARGFLQSVEQKIALEIDRAARAVNSSAKAIEGVKSLRELAERKLQMAQDGLELGVSSVTEVLEAEKNLTLVQRDEVKVFLDYQKKLILWEKVTGETLERFQIIL